MSGPEAPTTSPTLLAALADWQNVEAWEAFTQGYIPYIDACCRVAGLQDADVTEVRSRVLASLVTALRTLPYDPARRFRGYAPLWITRAAVFERKSVLFPGALFVVGFDTAVRLLDTKYYADEAARDASLRAIAEQGCRFVVGGRIDGAGIFQTWGIPGELFEVLTEQDFRLDLSSTELRGRA